LNISGLNSPSSIIDNLQNRQLRVQPTIKPLGITLAQPANTEDKVSISNEGQKKLSAELGSAMDKNVVISGGSKSADGDEVDTRTEIEKKIDKLKEDIKELQAQRRELMGDNSEEAELQRKHLDQQITMLNTQLMTLFKMQKNENR
jgi:hypothetical protein